MAHTPTPDDRAQAGDKQVRTATVPCAGCGAPLPIQLGGQAIVCAHCHHEQTIDPAIDARLRAHFHRVEAVLEDAARRRGRARIGAFAEKRGQLGCFAFLLFAGGAYGVVEAGSRGVTYAAAGVGIVGLLGLIAYLVAAPSGRPEWVDPVAGQVRCEACGGSVTILASTDAVECPFCRHPLRLTEAAFEQQIDVAEATDR